MGRQQYLTRLALGRSAFEPVEEPADTARMSELAEYDDHAQQYDSKGRPINPEIEAFNAEMRKAQNDVLALVGVVERKDLSDKAEERRNRNIRERRARILADEQEKGELLDYAFIPVAYLSHMWTDAFVQRIQIGFYDSRRSMAEILGTEWRGFFSEGMKNALARIFPGFGEIILHTIIRLPLIVAVEQLTGRIQSYVHKRRFKRKTAKRLYTAISILFEVALLGIDILLLPMEFHARAQRLSLAPPLPLFPPWKSFLPWHPTSFQQFGWKPLFGVAVLRSLTSPAILILLQKVFHWDAEDNEIPICGLFTTFRYPPINEPPRSPPPKDPTGWLMHKTYMIRASIMAWCGWDICRVGTNPEYGFENDSRMEYFPGQGKEDLGDTHVRIHRSTALAHLPAQRLAGSIDTFLARVITLPFESLMLRSIAHAFLLHSPSAKTPAAVAAHLYPPSLSGPVTQRLRYPTNHLAWTSAGTYISRLGLALALDASVDVLVFFGVYASTRYVGRTYFEWRPRRNRNLDRRRPGE